MNEPSGISFFGDVAWPAGIPDPFDELPGTAGRYSIVNLEGPIRAAPPVSGPIKLYNAPEPLLSAFRKWNVRVACLANNHLLDFGPPGETIEWLEAEGIAHCGAGRDLAGAARPAVVDWDGTTVVVAAFGWEVIRCPAAGTRRPGVNPLRPKHVLATIERARRQHPDALLAAVMHWDYELERYPLPLHRRLAFELVDRGVDVVVGHHPHCAQGLEMYRDRPIIYSLGNWFVPQGEWFGGPLHYPEYARRQLAFEWRPKEGDHLCHWFEYDPGTQRVRHTGSERMRSSSRVAELTPFAGMSHREYVRWFRTHRHKRKGLPVYADPSAVVGNALRDRWVAARHALITAAVAARLR